MNGEYRQALNHLEIARSNYNEAINDFEGVAYFEMKAAEEKVMKIIREAKVQVNVC